MKPKWTPELVDAAIRNAADKQGLTDLNNVFAVEIMGWHLISDDTKRIWRNRNGDIVKIEISHHEYSLCAHPWVDGINVADEISFNPAFNHHASMIDFRKMVEEKLLNKTLE